MGKRVTLLFVFCTLYIFSINLFAQAPVITNQPEWQGVIEGQTATFTVRATGNLLTYQWYKNGDSLSGAIDSIYTTPAIVLSDNGTVYSVKVSNGSGSDSSLAAKLFVTATGSRVRTNEIAEYTFKENGGDAIRDVSGINPKVNLYIDGTEKVAWSPNGLLVQAPVKIQSDTNTSKILNLCTSTNEITIEAWIVPHDTLQSDANIATYQGYGTSRRFSLIQNSRNYTVNTRITPGTDLSGNPGIRTRNGDVLLYLSHVVYTRSINDDSVKMFLNGQEISADTLKGNFDDWAGGSNAILALAGINPGGNNWLGTYYYLGIYNRALSNSEVEHNYKLGISTDFIPYIAKEPQDTNAVQGGTASFSVTALSYTLRSLSYQWQKNGVNISGATSADYTTDPLTLADYNSTYRVIVSNSRGSDTSRSAVLKLTLKTIPAPTNLVAIKYHADTTKVDLTWHDNSPNELGFIVQRKLGDSASISSYINIDTVVANVTAFTDSKTKDTTKYTYRILAYNADTTAYSNVATVTTPLPVELTSFTAGSVNGKMVIEWQTATEINNAGFSIERSIDNQKFSEVAFIKGKGTSTEKSLYSYTDNSALSGKYYYRLKQIDFDGTYSYSKKVEVDLGLPKTYALDQNYPNPFNPSTTIRFALPTNAKIDIKLYNTLGQEVANIINSELSAGVHETQFNASNLSSGVYFYRLEAKGNDGSVFTSTKRMLLLK